MSTRQNGSNYIKIVVAALYRVILQRDTICIAAIFVDTCWLTCILPQYTLTLRNIFLLFSSRKKVRSRRRSLISIDVSRIARTSLWYTLSQENIVRCVAVYHTSFFRTKESLSRKMFFNSRETLTRKHLLDYAYFGYSVLRYGTRKRLFNVILCNILPLLPSNKTVCSGRCIPVFSDPRRRLFDYTYPILRYIRVISNYPRR